MKFVPHLDRAGVSWRWYTYDVGTLRSVDHEYLVGHHGHFACVDKPKLPWEAALAEQLIVDEDSAGSVEDAQRGKLAPVSWIDPNFKDVNLAHAQTNDDHPPSDVQELVLLIYNALASGNAWDKTLLVVVYDEHGGFFDPVPPPQAPDDHPIGFGRHGSRVPALVVSPWVAEKSVSNTLFDHISIINTILTRFCPAAGATEGPPRGDPLARGGPPALHGKARGAGQPSRRAHGSPSQHRDRPRTATSWSSGSRRDTPSAYKRSPPRRCHSTPRGPALHRPAEGAAGRQRSTPHNNTHVATVNHAPKVAKKKAHRAVNKEEHVMRNIRRLITACLATAACMGAMVPANASAANNYLWFGNAVQSVTFIPLTSEPGQEYPSKDYAGYAWRPGPTPTFTAQYCPANGSVQGCTPSLLLEGFNSCNSSYCHISHDKSFDYNAWENTTLDFGAFWELAGSGVQGGTGYVCYDAWNAVAGAGMQTCAQTWGSWDQQRNGGVAGCNFPIENWGTLGGTAGVNGTTHGLFTTVSGSDEGNVSNFPYQDQEVSVSPTQLIQAITNFATACPSQAAGLNPAVYVPSDWTLYRIERGYEAGASNAYILSYEYLAYEDVYTL